MNEYIYFVWSHYSPSGKTSYWNVRSKSSGVILGYVMWYASWRQYCFFPADDTIWNTGCLQTLFEFCEIETKKHREKK